MLELLQYMDSLPDPKDTVRALDEYIIGQDDAKKNLSVLLLVRAMIKLQSKGLIPNDVEIQKTNLLLIGPTGSGKTALIKALAEIADVPILVKDMTGITSAGYIGGKMEDILVEYANLVYEWCSDAYNRMLDEQRINEEYDFETKLDFYYDTLNTGIIYLDEVDKIRCRDARGVDVTGDMIQNELLKLLEGNVVHLSNAGRGNLPKSGIKEVDTTHISFICGGAFAGLPEIILERINKSGGIGFNSTINSLNVDKDLSQILQHVKTEDLVKYGFKPEFLGRLPLKSKLDEITHKLMVQIITEPKEAIYKRYQGFFKLFNVNLTINKQAINEIAQQALDLKMGARSLHQIFNDLFIDDLTNIFELQNKRLYISKADVLKRLQ